MELRARRIASRLWAAVLAAAVIITALSFMVQPHLRESFRERPWGVIFPLLAIAGLVLMKSSQSFRAFLGSCVFITGALTSVVFGVYPLVLPSSMDPSLSLTIQNAAAPAYGLEIGLIWFVPGIALAIGYFFYTYRSFAGKVSV